jgi:predicted ATPase
VTGVAGLVTGLEVENFRGLRSVSLPLGPLNVLVGPNGAGKTSFTEVFRFLADSVTAGLEAALASRRGFDRILFRGGETEPEAMRIAVWGTWNAGSGHRRPVHGAAGGGIPDLYEITIRGWRNDRKWFLSREEELRFTAADGALLGITVREDRAEITMTGPTGAPPSERASPNSASPNSASPASAAPTDGGPASASPLTSRPLMFGVRRMSSALSSLGRLDADAGGEQSAVVAAALASVRPFVVDGEAARRAGAVPREGGVALEPNAANLASFLSALRDTHPRVWASLQADAVALLPGVIGIDLEPIGFDPVLGLPRRIAVVVYERGLRYPLTLEEASDGAVRTLALLAALHDPAPPALTIIEDVEAGPHPGGYARLVHRLRKASGRTQILATTRSPGFAERLAAEETISCDRWADGSAGPAPLRPPSAASSGW